MPYGMLIDAQIKHLEVFDHQGRRDGWRPILNVVRSQFMTMRGDEVGYLSDKVGVLPAGRNRTAEHQADVDVAQLGSRRAEGFCRRLDLSHSLSTWRRRWPPSTVSVELYIVISTPIRRPASDT